MKSQAFKEANSAGKFMQEGVGKVGSFFQEKSKDVTTDNIKTGAASLGTNIAAGATDLKEHLIKAELGKKIFSFFGTKKEEGGKLDEDKPADPQSEPTTDAEEKK